MVKNLSIQTIPVHAAKLLSLIKDKKKVHRLEQCQLVHRKLMTMEKVCP